MDHPLYGAALYLNPGKLHPLIRDNEDAVVGQLRGSFHDVLARMMEDEELRDKIDAQSLDYEALAGKSATTSVQEMDLQGWLKKTQVQPMKKRKMTMIHMMIRI